MGRQCNDRWFESTRAPQITESVYIGWHIVAGRFDPAYTPFAGYLNRAWSAATALDSQTRRFQSPSAGQEGRPTRVTFVAATRPVPIELLLTSLKAVLRDERLGRTVAIGSLARSVCRSSHALSALTNIANYQAR